MKKIIYLVIFGILIWGGFFIKNKFFPAPEPIISYNTEIAEIGNVIKEIGVVGNVELVDEQKLRFNQTGKITKVNFSDGESVKKGQIIATLDDVDGQNSVKEAELNLEAAKLSLEDLYKPADESQIMNAKNTISSAEINIPNLEKEIETLKKSIENNLNSRKIELENSKKELENLQKSIENVQNSRKLEISNAENDLESDKKSLELAKKDLELLIATKENSLGNTEIGKTSAIISVENSFALNVIEIGDAIEKLDSIIGVSEDNRKKIQIYIDFLGAKDPISRGNAVSSLQNLMSDYEKLKTNVSNYSWNGNIEEIKKVQEEIIFVYEKLRDSSSLVYRTVDQSVTSLGSLSQEEIDMMKNSVSNYRSLGQEKATNIKNSLLNLDTLANTELISNSDNQEIAQKQKQISDMEIALKSKQNSINRMNDELKLLQDQNNLEISSKQNSIQKIIDDVEVLNKQNELDLQTRQNSLENAKNSLELAKISLRELQDGPTASNIARAKNSISSAELRLKSSQNDLDRFSLEAPFDGVLRKIDYKVGDNLTVESTSFVYLENPNLVEIKVLLDQIDIVNVSEKNKAKITFDAYSGEEFNAEISLIDTTPNNQSGVIFYEVRFVINDEKFDKKLLSGMTADVNIILEEKKGVLSVNSTAILEENSKYFVEVLENNLPLKKEVKIGLKSGIKTEIISGLEEGENVIIPDFQIEESVVNPFGGPGGGGF